MSIKSCKISRARFDDLCADLFRLTIKIVEGALKDANLKCQDIDTIVLVGGSTRIPKIEQLLRELFQGKKISKSINPDEAVAYGAAVLAAVVHGNASKKMQDMQLVEVTPLTLGVASGLNYANTTVVIKRNTCIPVSITKVYFTLRDNQTGMRFLIVQGEHHSACDKFQIGEFAIEGMPPRRARLEKASVTFSIDVNGILTVSAVSKSNAKVKGEITIKNVCGSLTKTEIDRMVADAENYRKQDRQMRKYYTARWELEQYAYEIQNTHENNNFIRKKCKEMFSWLGNCCRPTMGQFLQWKNELQQLTLLPKDRDLENEVEADEVVVLDVKTEKQEKDCSDCAAEDSSAPDNIEMADIVNDTSEARESTSTMGDEENTSGNNCDSDDDIEIILPIGTDVVYEIDV